MVHTTSLAGGFDLVDMFNKLQESQNRSLDELAATRYDLTETRKELSGSLKEQKRLSEIIKQKDEELIRLREQLAIFQKMLFGLNIQKKQ